MVPSPGVVVVVNSMELYVVFAVTLFITGTIYTFVVASKLYTLEILPKVSSTFTLIL